MNDFSTLKTRWAPVLRMCMTVFALASSAVASSQVPPRYVDALRRGNYEIFSGDVNSDGHVDILAKARPTIVPISLDDLIVPIPIFPSPTFAILSDASGSYSLIVNPSPSIRNSSVWQANTHDLAYGDVLGNGAGGMVIHARSANGVSFTIGTSVSNGQPQLIQHLSPASLGVDLGVTGTTIALGDTNNDGRADLVVRVNGLISNVFVADSDGTFDKPPDAKASAIAAWHAFRVSLDAGEANSALQFISAPVRPQYAAAFSVLANRITTMTQNWSALDAVSVRPDYAVFTLTQTYSGQTRLHFVTFSLEGDRWMIHGF